MHVVTFATVADQFIVIKINTNIYKLKNNSNYNNNNNNN